MTMEPQNNKNVHDSSNTLKSYLQNEIYLKTLAYFEAAQRKIRQSNEF